MPNGAYVFDLAIGIPNATRLFLVNSVEIFSPNDLDNPLELHSRLELRTAPASNRLYGTYIICTRNGNSDLIKLNPLWLPGASLQDVLQVVPSGVATATGLITALAAWRSGATGNTRKNNLLQEMKNLGQFEQVSIPGTV